MTRMINCFREMLDQRKSLKSYLQRGPLLEVSIIVNLWYNVSKIWTYIELMLWLCWIRFGSGDKDCTNVSQLIQIISIFYLTDFALEVSLFGSCCRFCTLPLWIYQWLLTNSIEIGRLGGDLVKIKSTTM